MGVWYSDSYERVSGMEFSGFEPQQRMQGVKRQTLVPNVLENRPCKIKLKKKEPFKRSPISETI